MDTTETTTDLVITDVEDVEETDSLGNEIVKNTAISAATAGVMIGAVLAYKYLKPRVASLFSRSTETETTEEVPAETPAETPETKQD